MMKEYFGQLMIGSLDGNWIVPGWLMALFPILIVWSLAWKGWALWKSARESQKSWFIVMLILNTVGILEILYIFVFSKKGCCGKKEEEKPNQPTQV